MGIWRRIFEFGNQLEKYKPVAKRRWVVSIVALNEFP